MKKVLLILLIVIGILFSGCNIQEDLVKFSDPNLESIVMNEIGKPECDIQKKHLLEIKKLDASNQNIEVLNGIEYLVNLEVLNLNSNRISDITLLSELTNLQTLYLQNNEIVDLKPLSQLTNLQSLWLGNNKISDLWPLKNHVELYELHLYNNQIKNISPLENLFSTNMTILLNDNPIEDYSPLYKPFKARLKLPDDAPTVGFLKEADEGARLHDGKIENDKIVFNGDKFKISFKLPLEWKGKYLISETKDKVLVFHNPTHEEEPANFFSISVFGTKEEWEDMHENERWPNEEFAYRNEDVIVLNKLNYRPYQNFEADKREFEIMLKDVDNIISTIELFD